MNESFHGQERLLGLLENRLNEFQADNLGPDHVVADLLVVLLLVLTLNTQLDNAFEYQNGVVECALGLI